MTAKLTNHQLKMCALAGNVEIAEWYQECPFIISDTWTPFVSTSAGEWLRKWNPLTPEGSQNLMADARIDVIWTLVLNKVYARSRLNEDSIKYIESDMLFVSDYPSGPEAMRRAIVLCAVAKGEAMLKEKDNDKS